MTDTNTQVIEITAVFTSLSQPHDVVVIKPFRLRLIELCQHCKFEEYPRLGGSGKFSVYKLMQVLD